MNLPSLNLAITPLTASAESHWAIWVTAAPYPSGHVHHDRHWNPSLSQLWSAWGALFAHQVPPQFAAATLSRTEDWLDDRPTNSESQSSRLMQGLGLALWQWLLDGPIHTAFSQSQGIAMGQNRPLRLRLDVQDPELMVLPWEIMQPQNGKGAISLNPQVLLSRTSNDVDHLIPLKLTRDLRLLLVLGDHQTTPLRLMTEAGLLQQNALSGGYPLVPYHLETLVQPSRAELLDTLDRGQYNLFFYGGHGMTAPDGGRLCLRSGDLLSGRELAQTLVRNHIVLAVFNACWGAQQDYVQNLETGHLDIVPRSSLAETLIHHGVPAVLGMRHEIADEEALSFIQQFMQALRGHYLIDEAVTIARQHLLSLYGFNQPSWTLPVLYMHPEFNGQVIGATEVRTELPTDVPFENPFPTAEIRDLESNQVWVIEAGLLRVGRREENDLVLGEPWVSQYHAKIICRTSEDQDQPVYFIEDDSRFGTFVYQDNECTVRIDLPPSVSNCQYKCLHHQRMPLSSGTLLCFGSRQGRLFQFIIVHEKY